MKKLLSKFRNNNLDDEKNINLKKNLSLYKLARDKFKEEYDFKGKILEIGPLNNPFFKKRDVDVYYADIKNTDEVKSRYEDFTSEENIIPIDYAIEESYEKTFKDENIKFDYVFLSHVIEHIPNPINFLLDVGHILTDNGKLCFLIPDKRYTIDHYRENSSFADWFDVFIRGEEINTPRLVLDNRIDRVDESVASKFWNYELEKYPSFDPKACIDMYHDFVNNFDELSFDEHYWVFSDQSFLRILENLYKTNLIPYKIISFYPTPFDNNTFGIVLELNSDIQKDFEYRQSIIDEMREVSKVLDEKHFEIDQFVYLKKKFYNKNFDKYDTCRIDIKNNGNSENSVEILNISDYLANYNYPVWFENKSGKGLKIQSRSPRLNIDILCINDGKLDISLKSLDIRDSSNSRIPIYVKYSKFLVNDSLIFDEEKLVWHDEPFKYSKNVKNNEVVNLQIEWESF